MARPSNSIARQAEIVNALQTVMARHGYEKATIQMIAAEAGLAPGLLHYHFKRKQDILMALVATLADVGQQRFAHLASGLTDPVLRLRAYIDARLALGAGAAPDVVGAWVMIGAQAVRDAEVREAYGRAVAAELALVTGLLEQVHADAVHLAPGLLAIIEGAYQLACAAGEVMPAGYAAEAAWRYVQMPLCNKNNSSGQT